MCNLDSLTKGPQAIRELSRAIRDTVGNLPPIPGDFADCADIEAHLCAWRSGRVSDVAGHARDFRPALQAGAERAAGGAGEDRGLGGDAGFVAELGEGTQSGGIGF